jgi:pyridinium-3,5-bisthiocarboxylic acid mononucleotide nickel chelatase
MKILYYDCFCGISGDMNLGALIDVGVPPDYLRAELSKLGMDGEFELVIKKDSKMGISGVKADVVLKEHGHHHHRHLKDIQDIINSSALKDSVKQKSLFMFEKIAIAEAKVHGVPVEEVHFHEVGAVDSIVDIVGAAIALNFLQPDKILASGVQVGGGFVHCAHGMLPVPAPATTEILSGIPIKTGLVQKETTTPTGAAILAANVSEFTDSFQFAVQKTGYGLGTRDLDIPNVLRVYLAETADETERAKQVLLETNIDDMNPELYAYAEEKLFEAGALDVFKTPIIMKKGRPAILLSVLVGAKEEAAVTRVLFRETTSIGLRRTVVDKVMLWREIVTVETPLGQVHVKKVFLDGELVGAKPEYEDVRRIAAERNMPIVQAYKEIEKNI